jgi:hypothetical protein
VHPPGKSPFGNLYGGHKIEPQKGKIGQVVSGQGFPIEVGMDQPKSLETRFGGPETLKAGNQYLFPVSTDHIRNITRSADKNTYLPLYVA